MTQQYQLHVIPALKDNYIWLLENQHHQVVIIDPSEAMPVIDYLSQHQLTPIGILLTHHHQDHIGGVTLLQNTYPKLNAFGPNEVNLDINKISSQSHIRIGDMTFDIIAVPGHTLGHLAYYIKPYLFCADTLFSGGCGRIFEGTYQQMFTSLNTLKALPDETIVCPAHEYTLSNLKFACSILPEDKVINDYYQQVQHVKMTLPTTLEKEKKINLFLRCDESRLQQKFNCQNALALFEFFRSQKDNF